MNPNEHEDDASDRDAGREDMQPREPARRTRRAGRSRVPPPDDAFPDGTFDEENRIAEILADELNNEANLEIYRKTKAGKWAFLDKLSLADWSPDAKLDLAAKYGGGEYKGRVRRTAESVRGTWGPSFHFTIDEQLKPRDQTPAGQPGGDLTQMLTLMERSDKTMPLFMQMMQMQAQASQMMMTQMQESNKTLVTILTAALKPGAPPPPPSEKLIEILATRALTPPPPPLQLADVINLVGKLKTIANSDKPLPPEAEDDAPRGGLLTSLIESLPSLLKVLGGIAAPDTPAEPRVVQALPAQPAPVAAEAPIRVAEPAPAAHVEPFPPLQDIAHAGPAPERAGHDLPDDDVKALRMMLPHLCALADGGTTAADVAAQIDASLPDEAFLRLADLLKREDWLALLIDAHEPVNLRTPFFTALRNELLTMVEPDDALGASEN